MEFLHYPSPQRQCLSVSVSLQRLTLELADVPLARPCVRQSKDLVSEL
jgi:hypothetical protein